MKRSICWVVILATLAACEPGESPPQTRETSTPSPAIVADRCAKMPPPFRATYLPRGFDSKLRDGAGLFKGTDYPTEGLLGHYIGPRETVHINFETYPGPLPYELNNPRPIVTLGGSGRIAAIEGGFGVGFTFKKCDFRMDTYGISRKETVRVARGLIGRDRSRASPSNNRSWPEGPFAHNCSPENADARGDFDGDGMAERARFEPVFDEDGHAGWTVVLGDRDGWHEESRARVDVECPEAIGATDVDQDGDDELFFDTGKGMTAALVDLLVYRAGKLREITYRPGSTLLYVGSSTSLRSDLRCFRPEGTPLFEIVTVDEQGARVTSTNFSLRGQVLVKTGPFPIRGDADGRLRCFGLEWTGY